MAVRSYFNRTQKIADFGGNYQEGIIGQQPRFLNPILAQTNDTDRDLVRIIFSSLLKYDDQGNLVSDLAESYEIKDNGLAYEFFLRKDVKWHEKEPLTADDVVFTVKTIQNPEYKSPLKINWSGVEVEKVDDYTVRFTLKNTFAPFLHNMTVGILPKHLWAGISAQNFPLAEYNLKPVGSGPYKFKELKKDKSGAVQFIELEKNKNFYLKKPYINNLIFRFYQSEAAAVQALNKRQVDGLNFISTAQKSKIIRRDINVYQISLPRYYGVFFNQTQSKPLSDKTVRLALAYATDKKEIVERVLGGNGLSVDSPLLPGLLGYTTETKIYDFFKQFLSLNFQSKFFPNLFSFFTFELLRLAGLSPELQNCLHCHDVISPGKNYFDFQHGGLICSNCAIKTKEQNQPISNEAIKVLRYLRHYSLTKSLALKLNDNLSLEIKKASINV